MQTEGVLHNDGTFNSNINIRHINFIMKSIRKFFFNCLLFNNATFRILLQSAKYSKDLDYLNKMQA